MDYLACITRLLPNWNGTVVNNEYGGIKPDVSEIRPTPALAELEAIWPTIQAEQEKESWNAAIYAKLAEIDAKTIRSLRDKDDTWIAKYKKEADDERAKIRK